MNIKKIKKIISILIASVFVLGLACCGNNKETASNNIDKSEETSEEVKDTETGGESDPDADTSNLPEEQQDNVELSKAFNQIVTGMFNIDWSDESQKATLAAYLDKNATPEVKNRIIAWEDARESDEQRSELSNLKIIALGESSTKGTYVVNFTGTLKSSNGVELKFGDNKDGTHSGFVMKKNDNGSFTIVDFGLFLQK